MHPGPLKRASVAGRVLVAAIVFVLPVAADAPISGAERQYDVFGPTDVTITDRFTGLKWSRPKQGASYPVETKALAETRCAAASSRLPTVKELLTLVDEEPHAEYVQENLRNEPRYIDGRAFRGTPPDFAFWTSTKPAVGSGTFTVDFATGLVDKATGPSDPRAVLCVK